MEVIGDTLQWSEHTFGSADLNDCRRTQRLVASAAKIACHPEKSFTQVFDWNELRAFYRLCDQSEATLAAVQGPHWHQTRQAMGRHDLVLIVHDTTELDFTTHLHLTGAGPIGDGNGQGFLQHNSLAVLPAPRQILGLAYQQLRVREPAPEQESTYQRKRRARESQMWQEGFRAPGRPPEGCCWVDVCDRGSDDYEAVRAATEVGHHFLVRIYQKRLVFVSPQQDRQEYLLDFARSLPSQGSDVLEIKGRGGRPARKAVVAMAAAPVWVPAPKGTARRKSQPVIPAWVIRIWEPHPPVGIEEPLEWLLLCSLPTNTLEELCQRRDWYCCRWLVEIYHDIEKNGCSEEGRRFETAARMETCLALLAVVAIRVFQLRCALEVQPEKRAEEVATQAEIAVVKRVLKTKKKLTVRDFVHGVAKLGGFLGRTRDGEPGVRALWRGYQRLQDMLFGLQLQASPTDNSG